MSLPPRWAGEVSHPADVIRARRAARGLARALGFDEVGATELTLAVSELASNLVKHAGRGTITLSPYEEQGYKGLRVVSEDRGPGIPDVEAAVSDGFSTGGSLGAGLGAVHRLMDELDITSPVAAVGGTRIECARTSRPRLRAITRCPLDIGGASRAHPGMAHNGDGMLIKTWESHALVAVVDGLGHGQYAHRATKKALAYLETHYRLPLKALFQGVGRECIATRGCVMAIARFDWEAGAVRHASIGNVDTRVVGTPEPLKLVGRRGVLGARAPTPAVNSGPWDPASSKMVMYSDGISSRWDWRDLADMSGDGAQATANAMLARLGKDQDDATVVVIKGAQR